MSKNVILLCDQYPNSNGEFFIDDEMRVASQRFEHIFIITRKSEHDSSHRYVPENATIIEYNPHFSWKEKLRTCLFLVSPFFVKEAVFVVRTQKPKHWFTIFKIQFVCLLQAQDLYRFLVKECSIQNCICYSYWHDYKAMALAFLKRKNAKAICIARAHGWDIYAERQQTPYLPFKSFIFKNLTQTYSISESGRSYFLQQFGNSLSSHVAVSRLGKFNTRVPNMQKAGHILTICSCSSIIPVKRVQCIIDILAELESDFQIRWIHFGDGLLRQEIEQCVKTRLKRTQVDIKGIVPNAEILDFYASNYIDLFINVSSSEGIPVSIMEALSAGIPVVATNVGGTSEAVSENCGFLLPENLDVHQATSIIKNYMSLSELKQQEYRKSAYAFWKDNYEAGGNYELFYNEIDSL